MPRPAAVRRGKRNHAMIEDISGNIDYEESGTGPTMVLVPGSCSTGAAWRPVIAAWENRFRCVTTSLPGYGGTAERRTPGDSSISHEAEALEFGYSKSRRPRPSGRPLLRRPGGARRGAARPGQARKPYRHRGAGRDDAGRKRGDQHIRAFGEMTSALFRRLQGWQGRRDRGADRLFRRRRHLCLVAAAGSRLRHGDDAGQHPRLGNRV